MGPPGSSAGTRADEHRTAFVTNRQATKYKVIGANKVGIRFLLRKHRLEMCSHLDLSDVRPT